MSNQVKTRRREYRLQLMATVSAVVLLGCGAEAAARDADRPPLWIELGWQYERAGGGQETFTQPFFDLLEADGFTPLTKFENALPWSYGAEGKISYRPESSDWVVFAALRYGRAHGHKSVHQQTSVNPAGLGQKFAQTKASNTETHTILDFQAGRDVGVGLFGSGGASVLSAGVRYAQIQFGSHTEITADPDKYFPTNIRNVFHNHFYAATNSETRSFSGLGPSLAWSASAPLFGKVQDGGLSLDWGINAGILFGKQKASGQHQFKSDYYKSQLGHGRHNYHYVGPVVPHDRSRSAMAPNLGGIAGFSLNWTNAKVSVGYRADVFFNAIDGGIDTRKSVNRGFYGPFASISIGLGD